ncbi:FAD-binding oxidoreductase [Microbacterium testaceum]|uniref:FAD-binding oxidoreductase n=1 Tax=Microbacterium testaceum TaxID=2033 RepID=UPI0009BD3758|nr:FAD-binding oxidoreductase [Microbacterium testaceum]
MSSLPQIPFASLRDVVRGRVVLPADAEFEDVRRPWNLAIEQSPSAVVEAVDADDVAAVLRFASTHAVPVTAQPSGHGATGRADGAILLRTGNIDSISVDPDARTARIGAGVRSGDLQRAAAAHSLTALPGSSPVVTVTGAALGGGLSWFSRRFGWMADSVLAADIVLADGTIRRVDDSDPELLWALRGGGGELAIVTSVEVRLRPAPAVFGGRLLWAATDSRAVAEVYRAMTRSAPDELTLWLELLHFPGVEPMIAIDVTYLGLEENAREWMRPVESLPVPLSDTRGMLSAADLGGITAEPTAPSAGLSRGELLAHLDDTALDALVNEPIAPLMTVQIRHLGGALSQPSDSPHGPLREPYAVYLFGVPASAEIAASIRAAQERLIASLPVTGRKPITFLTRSESLADALPVTSLQRLRRLKDALDPDGIIRGNFGLPDAERISSKNFDADMMGTSANGIPDME